MFLYDPITNEKRKITYEKLCGITGRNIHSLRKDKANRVKIKCINCYLLPDDTSIEFLRSLMEKEEIDNEVWFYIKNSDKKYKVSDKGRVKSIKYTKSGRVERLLMPYLKKNAPAVEIKINDKYVTKYVSNLVAEAFLKYDNNSLLFHIDGNSYNNKVENLEYRPKDFVKKKVAEKNGIPVIKLDKNTLTEIDSYSNISEAARENYIDNSCISACVKGKQKTAGGFVWKIDYESFSAIG